MRDHPRVIKAKERFTEAMKELMEEDAEKRVPKRLRFEQERGSEPTQMNIKTLVRQAVLDLVSKEALRTQLLSGNEFVKMKMWKINP